MIKTSSLLPKPTSAFRKPPKMNLKAGASSYRKKKPKKNITETLIREKREKNDYRGET